MVSISCQSDKILLRTDKERKNVPQISYGQFDFDAILNEFSSARNLQKDDVLSSTRNRHNVSNRKTIEVGQTTFINTSYVRKTY